MGKVKRATPQEQLCERFAGLGLDEEFTCFLKEAVGRADERNASAVLEELIQAQQELNILASSLSMQRSNAHAMPSVQRAIGLEDPRELQRESPALSRVLVVEDHAVIRAGLEAVLDDSDEVDVVGTADLASALKAASKLLPDIVLLHLDNAIERLKPTFKTKISKVLASTARPTVMVLSPFPQSHMSEFFKPFPSGSSVVFVEKSESPRRLIEQITQLAEQKASIPGRTTGAQRREVRLWRTTMDALRLLKHKGGANAVEAISDELKIELGEYFLRKEVERQTQQKQRVHYTAKPRVKGPSGEPTA